MTRASGGCETGRTRRTKRGPRCAVHPALKREELRLLRRAPAYARLSLVPRMARCRLPGNYQTFLRDGRPRQMTHAERDLEGLRACA